MILVLGALLGFVAVAFGAFAEHGLRENITAEHFRFLMTAVRYNQIHAVVIVALGLAVQNGGGIAKLAIFRWSGVVFILGTVLFSFSIYISVSFGWPRLLLVTPVGGMGLMLAWIMLVVAGVRAIRK